MRFEVEYWDKEGRLRNIIVDCKDETKILKAITRKTRARWKRPSSIRKFKIIETTVEGEKTKRRQVSGVG